MAFTGISITETLPVKEFVFGGWRVTLQGLTFKSVVKGYKYCKGALVEINLLSKPGFVEFYYFRVLPWGRERSSLNANNNSIVQTIISVSATDDGIFQLMATIKIIRRFYVILQCLLSIKPVGAFYLN